MKASGSVTLPVLGVLVPLLALALVSCKEDEAPPPLPSAAPAPAPPEPAVLTIAEEDAAVDVAEDVKKTGVGRPPNTLSTCCAALNQNAANAPEPNASYLRTAATLCSGAAAAGSAPGSVLPQIRAALKGMNMPAGCQ
ncbi:MAG TPA: hypothetical protein VFU02_11535 [Polyangiaceae bacterium]|nr:hypothetical protein [Polyangiaceae bacterium]